MSELLVVHIGQCGVQIATSFWELLCLEHAVSVDGEIIPNEDSTIYPNVFFQEVNEGRVIPRSIVIDGECTVIDEIKNGAYRNLFNQEYFINSNDDSCSNFARGSFLVGAQCIKGFSRSLHKLGEQVGRLSEIMLIQSICGGSGSGLGALLLQEMQLEFAKVAKVQFAVFPSSVMCTAVVEPYNATFHGHTTVETCDLTILFDNEAFYNICKNIIGINSPNYSVINRLISLMITSASSSMRFSNTITSGINEMHTNLIPYPRIHYCITSYAPLSPESMIPYINPSVEEITKNVLSREYQGIKCDTNREKYISILLNYRGLVTPVDVGQYLAKVKASNGIQLVEWCPTGFKIGINSQCPVMVPESLIGFSNKSVTMIANSTAIRTNFELLSRKFDLLYSKRSFVHWFINEGIEEIEFGDSRLDMQLLIEDYQEISMSESELMEQLDANPSKRERSFSVRPSETNEVKHNSQDE